MSGVGAKNCYLVWLSPARSAALLCRFTDAIVEGALLVHSRARVQRCWQFLSVLHVAGIRSNTCWSESVPQLGKPFSNTCVCSARAASGGSRDAGEGEDGVLCCLTCSRQLPLCSWCPSVLLFGDFIYRSIYPYLLPFLSFSCEGYFFNLSRKKKILCKHPIYPLVISVDILQIISVSDSTAIENQIISML